MKARYNGKCRQCGEPIMAGTDCHYDPVEKTIQCWQCFDNPKPTPEQYELADKLGFS